MIEKLAEIIREDARRSDHRPIPCFMCSNQNKMTECWDYPCPKNNDNRGSQMIARYAVLLVAKGLEKEIERLSLFRGLPPSEAAMEAAAKLGASIYNLITEAKEGKE